MVDVVCVGAHPDDVEIGMGGTIAGFVQRGVSVAIVDLTDGEPTPRGTHDTRMREAARAADILGVKRVTLGLPNRYLFDDVDSRTQLAEVLRELQPSLMFVPFADDAHPDHVAAHAIAAAARFYAKFTKTDMAGEPHYPGKVYQYMAVHQRVIREPSFIVDISDQLERKVQALLAYESQFASNTANQDVIPLIEGFARTWGTAIRCAAGEPFFSVEPVGVVRIEDLV